MLVLRCYGFCTVLNSPRWLVSVGVKARVQRTGFRVVREGDQREKQERVLHTGALFLNSPIWPRPQAAARISVRVGRSPTCTAPLARHMITRHLIFNST